jgi:3-deoxy-D-arabino-heptulosonate 7-phosphate (DAHP) synthase
MDNEMTFMEFAKADPFTMAGFDAETVREMQEAQSKTGLPAETIIAFYRKYKTVVKKDG